MIYFLSLLGPPRIAVENKFHHINLSWLMQVITRLFLEWQPCQSSIEGYGFPQINHTIELKARLPMFPFSLYKKRNGMAAIPKMLLFVYIAKPMLCHSLQCYHCLLCVYCSLNRSKDATGDIYFKHEMIKREMDLQFKRNSPITNTFWNWPILRL